MNNFIKFCLSFIVFLFFWELLILYKSDNGLLPKPIPVFSSFGTIFSEPKNLETIGNTLMTIMRAMLYISFVGILFGLLLGYFKKVYEYVKGLISYFRSIPPIVLFPLFAYVLFGSSDTARIACACFGCIPILIVIIADCIYNIPNEKIEFAKINKASNWFLIRNIYCYELLPSILLGLRLAISFCIIIIVVTEMIDEGSKRGIGAEIISTRMNSDYNLQFAYILIAGLIGYLLNELIYFVEAKTIKWKTK